MSVQRPWWASDDAPGSHRADDPVVAFRAARRGEQHGDPVPSEATPGDVDDPAADDPTHAGEHVAAACGVCPWCTTVRLVAQHHPELLGHVREAGRHLSLAARAALDAAVTVQLGRQPAAADDLPTDDPPAATPEVPIDPRVAPPDGRLHRIVLDPGTR